MKTVPDTFAAHPSAAQSGLQPGDILVRLDGKPSPVPEDLYQASAEKDPGANLSVEFRRSGNAGTANVALNPRTP